MDGRVVRGAGGAFEEFPFLIGVDPFGRSGRRAWVGGCAGNDNSLAFGDFGDGSEISEVIVGGDFFDLRRLFGFELWVAREVGGGDLEAIEEDAAALVLDVSAGDAAEDFVEGELDGGSVVDARHGEAVGVSGDSGLAAGAAVVVAEALAAEGGRAATVAFGEDVAAEVTAFWVGFGLRRFSEFGCVHGAS